MNKFLKKLTTCVLAFAAFAFSGCSAADTGSERNDTGMFVMYCGYNGESAFELYEGRFVVFDNADFSYRFEKNNPFSDSKTYYLAYNSLLYSVKNTDAENFSYDKNGEGRTNPVAEKVINRIGSETYADSFSFDLDGGQCIVAVNTYFKSGGDGSKLYKEDINRSFVYLYEEGGELVQLKEFDGCVIMSLNSRYAVYERGNYIFSYDMEEDTEKLLFKDEEYDRTLQHGNKISVKTNGEYVLFTRTRARISGDMVTYTIAKFDASLVVDLCTTGR